MLLWVLHGESNRGQVCALVGVVVYVVHVVRGNAWPMLLSPCNTTINPHRISSNPTSSPNTAKSRKSTIRSGMYTGMHPHAPSHQEYRVLHGRQRPGITKNDYNNSTNITSNNPTMQPPNSQRTKLKPRHLSSNSNVL